MKTLNLESHDDEKRSVVTVVGAGHAGCNVVEKLRQRGSNDVAIIKAEKLPLNSDEIRSSFESNGTRLVVVVAGLGGDTACSVATEVAEIAREGEIAVMGIVTTPYLFEMRIRMNKAFEDIKILESNLDSLMVIENERFAQSSDFDVRDSFNVSDSAIIDVIDGINAIINSDGYVMLDFNDVVAVLKGGKKLYYLCGESAEPESRVISAFMNATNSSPMSLDDFQACDKALVSFESSSQKEITTSEIGDFVSKTKNYASEGFWIKTGYCYDDALGDKVRIRIFASSK